MGNLLKWRESVCGSIRRGTYFREFGGCLHYTIKRTKLQGEAFFLEKKGVKPNGLQRMGRGREKIMKASRSPHVFVTNVL